MFEGRFGRNFIKVFFFLNMEAFGRQARLARNYVERHSFSVHYFLLQRFKTIGSIQNENNIRDQNEIIENKTTQETGP